jgi:hypothetical protein
MPRRRVKTAVLCGLREFSALFAVRSFTAKVAKKDRKDRQELRGLVSGC